MEGIVCAGIVWGLFNKHRREMPPALQHIVQRHFQDGSHIMALDAMIEFLVSAPSLDDDDRAGINAILDAGVMKAWSNEIRQRMSA